ncbi:hypothetical protein TNCV_4052741 [Trichonephila clavipes]|nr:hypothetical protein TNCV_4052741 [Trichonephila clavipes]
MTTTSYRSRLAVGVRHFFRRGNYSAVRSRFGARGTMTTTSYRVRAVALLCCPVASWCTRNDDNDILPQPRRWVFVTFFRRGTTLLSGRSWCTRNDDNDILPQPFGGGMFVNFFSSRHYSAVRSRLCSRGTMTTTSYRVRAAVGVRHLFPSRHYSAARSRLGARGTMTTTSYRSRLAVGVRHFFPSRHYSAVRSRFGARGTMTTTSYRVHAWWVFVTFFPLGTTLLSGRILVHAER